jgi:hypothetical protein
VTFEPQHCTFNSGTRAVPQLVISEAVGNQVLYAVSAGFRVGEIGVGAEGVGVRVMQHKVQKIRLRHGQRLRPASPPLTVTTAPDIWGYYLPDSLT